MDRQKSIRRGFSLVESAIVLGVVGLVIGGIWVAAETMYENYKVNKTVEWLSYVSTNIQKLISIRDAGEIDATGFHNNGLYDANVFPADSGTSWDKINHPFGGGGGQIDNYPPSFRIHLYTIPKSACANLIVKASTLNNINRIAVYNGVVPVYNVTVFPVSPSSASVGCDLAASPVRLIYFQFNYTRIN